MKRTFIAALVLSSTLVATGCATQSIRQGQDLSSSGVAYTDAVDKLLDVTTDRVINFDSAELIKTRRGSDLKKMITEKNEALQSVLVELGRFRAQTRLLKTYFVNLQALADSPVKNDAGGAVKSLSDSISKLNKALGKTDGKEKLSEEQKTQIGGLGGLVAHTIHGANVKRALERDAEIIGTYLALQENQLGNIVDMLEDRAQNDNDLFLNERVIAPYVAKDKPLGDSWIKDRREWAKTRCVSQQLKTAQEAAKHLRGVWEDILEGETDINSLSILIYDISEFVTSVQALETANGAR
jgi:predicted small secreted protein